MSRFIVDLQGEIGGGDDLSGTGCPNINDQPVLSNFEIRERQALGLQENTVLEFSARHIIGDGPARFAVVKVYQHTLQLIILIGGGSAQFEQQPQRILAVEDALGRGLKLRAEIL